MKTLPENPTNYDKYFPATQVSTAEEAKEWFDICVQHSMSFFAMKRIDAEKREREAIAVAMYFGFHLSDKEIERLSRLYGIENESEWVQVFLKLQHA